MIRIEYERSYEGEVVNERTYEGKAMHTVSGRQKST